MLPKLLDPYEFAMLVGTVPVEIKHIEIVKGQILKSKTKRNKISERKYTKRRARYPKRINMMHVTLTGEV